MIKTKQPTGLSIFFLTEMWERYGFYLIQILLILYVLDHFHLSDYAGYALLGSFTALAYITPIIGGYLADFALGYRKAILLGLILLAIGYATIALSQTLTQVTWCLALISTGTGLVKPNISSMLGTLYSNSDIRRDSGYTFFYVGINVGIILSETLSGYLQETFGWHLTFASGTVALLIGFITFYFGCKFYNLTEHRTIANSFKKQMVTYLLLIATILISQLIFSHPKIAFLAFTIIAIISLIIVLTKIFNAKNKVRTHLSAYLLLTLISVLFWAFYFQLFSSFNLYTLRVVNHVIFGLHIPTPFFAGIEAIGVLVFGIVLGQIWLKLKATRFNPSTPMKFTLSLFFLAVAFGILASSSGLSPASLSSPWFIAIAYLFISLGELSLSPIGLAMVSELVPASMTGLMMGIFFISLGLGGKLAGFLADFASIPTNITSLTAIKAAYHTAFVHYFYLTLIVMILAFILTPLIKRLMK